MPNFAHNTNSTYSCAADNTDDAIRAILNLPLLETANEFTATEIQNGASQEGFECSFEWVEEYLQYLCVIQYLPFHFNENAKPLQAVYSRLRCQHCGTYLTEDDMLLKDLYEDDEDDCLDEDREISKDELIAELEALISGREPHSCINCMQGG